MSIYNVFRLSLEKYSKVTENEKSINAMLSNNFYLAVDLFDDKKPFIKITAKKDISITRVYQIEIYAIYYDYTKIFSWMWGALYGKAEDNKMSIETSKKFLDVGLGSDVLDPEARELLLRPNIIIQDKYHLINMKAFIHYLCQTQYVAPITIKHGNSTSEIFYLFKRATAMDEILELAAELNKK